MHADSNECNKWKTQMIMQEDDHEHIKDNFLTVLDNSTE